MNRTVATTKVVFAVTFAVLWLVLLEDRKYASLAFFAAIFLFGIFAQGRKYFWKAALIFFGLLSVIYSFGILGGLEPNSRGILSTGNWVNLKFLLFLMLIFSTALSFFVGLRSSTSKGCGS